ncbi:hypothetical protein IF1G_00477 [Cordyceps javanica]|uniref:Uncharacterized protein n=1 Tax=Cordyceps javanica TaxID=43265 RepID=A0A545VFQ2_9HYPO|nr:hypothetical protein IF1G_00477 [Cordyceps javanica]
MWWRRTAKSMHLGAHPILLRPRATAPAEMAQQGWSKYTRAIPQRHFLGQTNMEIIKTESTRLPYQAWRLFIQMAARVDTSAITSLLPPMDIATTSCQIQK